MQKWYVIQVFSGQEKKAKKALEENRELKKMGAFLTEVLVPTENVAEVKNGKQYVTEKRLWPGYILVKMELTDESWDYVKHTNGIIDFLGGGAPTPLTDKEVEQILSELKDKKQSVTQKHKFIAGDKVRITDGVFVNFIGTVLDVFHDKGRLSVMVSIFGRDTRVDDLEFWQVEEVSDEAHEQA
jgi:transcriptional antiterminator NusG